MIIYLLNTFATDQSIAEYNASIIQYVQPLSMPLQQYVVDASADSCKVTEIYNSRTLSDAFIQGVEPSMQHNLLGYWTKYLQPDLVETCFQENSLLAIHKESSNQITNNQRQTKSEKSYISKLWNDRPQHLLTHNGRHTLRGYMAVRPRLLKRHSNLPQNPRENTPATSDLYSSFTALQATHSIRKNFDSLVGQPTI